MAQLKDTTINGNLAVSGSIKKNGKEFALSDDLSTETTARSDGDTAIRNELKNGTLVPSSAGSAGKLVTVTLNNFTDINSSHVGSLVYIRNRVCPNKAMIIYSKNYWSADGRWHDSFNIKEEEKGLLPKGPLGYGTVASEFFLQGITLFVSRYIDHNNFETLLLDFEKYESYYLDYEAHGWFYSIQLFGEKSVKKLSMKNGSIIIGGCSDADDPPG